MNNDNWIIVETPLGDNLVNKTIDETIGMVFQLLGLLYQCCNENIKYDEYLEGISKQIDDGEISNSLVEDALLFHINKDVRNLFSSSFHLSCSYAILAKRANDNGERDKAWALIAEARYRYAISEYSRLDANLSAALHDARSAGGQTTAKKRSEQNKAKVEAIRVLEEERPKNGWDSEFDAASSILDALFELIDIGDLESLAKREDLKEVILSWIRDDEDVSDAFYKNRKI